MKIIFIIIDGLGDESIPALGDKTPLEAAKTPNLDFLAKKGICGLVLPWVKKGKLPTSEDTHLALFGFNPRIYNPGRGVLEALGIGMKILPGDVCLRGNFATVDSKRKIIDRRAGRIEETEDLIRIIEGINIGGVKFLIGKAVSYRIGIVMRGKNLSAKVSDGDPKTAGIRHLQIKALNKSKEAKFTAQILNQFLEKTRSILKKHPLNKKRKLLANYILVRGAGSFKKALNFYEKYKLKAGCIAAGTLYKGVGKYLGMNSVEVKGATGLSDTNLPGKFLAAKKAFKKYSFIFLHIKATDTFSHDGDFLGKKEFIERIDKNLKPILGLKNSLIVITGDHSACSLRKQHCSKPLPVLIYSDRIEADTVKEFSEKACKKGKLGKIKQPNLMQKVLFYNK